MPQSVPKAGDDTILFTSVLSISVHALALLGLGFLASSLPAISSVDLVLVQEASSAEVLDSDFRSSENQLQSGEDEKDQPPRTLQTPLLVVPSIQPQSSLIFSVDGTDNDPSFNRKSSLSDQITSIEADESSATGPRGARSNSRLLGVDDQVLNAHIASIEAYLGELERTYATRPKIKRYTSLASEKAVEAEYIDRWVKKIELVGNLNYPERALREDISGDLRLLVALSNQGEVLEVQLLKSSGFTLLDDAARNIVHLASPFGNFPLQMKQEVDIIEIVRTWKFLDAGDFRIEGG